MGGLQGFIRTPPIFSGFFFFLPEFNTPIICFCGCLTRNAATAFKHVAKIVGERDKRWPFSRGGYVTPNVVPRHPLLAIVRSQLNPICIQLLLTCFHALNTPSLFSLSFKLFLIYFNIFFIFITNFIQFNKKKNIFI